MKSRTIITVFRSSDPSRPMRARYLVWGAVLLSVRLFAVTSDIIVVGDVMPAWVQAAPPTPAAPLYYLPLIGGTKESAPEVPGHVQSLRIEVMQALAGALAQRGYFLTNETHPPNLLLVLRWGTMKPELADFSSGDPDEPPNVAFFNGREMRSLVGMYKSNEFQLMENSRLNDASRENRFYLYVMAFDFTATRQHGKKLLWSTKMSMPTEGTTLPEALTALIAAGGSHLGCDTKPPLIIGANGSRNEHVNLGELQVHEYLPPSEKK